MPDIDDLAEKWVVPLYLDILHANYIRNLDAEKRLFDECVLAALREISEADIRELLAPASNLEETGWREQLTASWLCWLKGWRQFSGLIGKLLLASEMCYAGQGFCFALACFATEESAQHLTTYLATYLPQANLDYDQDWAMPALLWVDEQLGTAHAAQFLQPGGLWEQFMAGKSQHPPAQALHVYRRNFWELMQYCQAHFLAAP